MKSNNKSLTMTKKIEVKPGKIRGWPPITTTLFCMVCDQEVEPRFLCKCPNRDDNKKLKEKWNEYYRDAHINQYDRDKAWQFIEKALLIQKRELLEEIIDLIHKRKQEWHKDCLTDKFNNGRFWEDQELYEILTNLQGSEDK